MKNLKTYFSIIASAMIVIATAITSQSCSNEDNIISKNETSANDTPSDTTGLVFSYDKFLTAGDVKIESADTTLISVSERFLRSQNIKVDKDKAVCIWRTMDTTPFVRIIKEYKQQGNRLILTTKSGDLGDMFSSKDLKMNTEIYVDEKAPSPAVSTRAGGKKGVNYNRYTDSKNVLHPAVILVRTPGEMVAGTRAVTTKVYTAEKIVEDNASFKFLNIHTNRHNFRVGNDNAYFFIKDLAFNAESSFNIDASIRWFKLRYFKCYVDGYANSSFTSGFALEAKGKKSFEQNALSFPSYTAVFWAGPIPVAVTLESGIKLAGKIEASARLSVSTDFKFDASYKQGVQYIRGDGWNVIKDSHSSASANFKGLTAQGTIKAKAGVYLYAGLMLYGCAGPELSIGPSIGADATASHTLLNGKPALSISTKGSLQLGGEVAAKLKIWKWNLLSWNKDFTFWEKELWNKKYTL